MDDTDIIVFDKLNITDTYIRFVGDCDKKANDTLPVIQENPFAQEAQETPSIDTYLILIDKVPTYIFQGTPAQLYDAINKVATNLRRDEMFIKHGINECSVIRKIAWFTVVVNKITTMKLPLL